MIRSILNFIFLTLVFAPVDLLGQEIINAYAKVTDISGTSLTLSDANIVYGDFTAGDDIIIMQMQDDVIGANTGDDPTFGNISTIASAGLYEKATIASVDAGGIQTLTIWNEDFDDLNNGDTADSGPTFWTRSCDGGGTGCYSGTGRSLQVNSTNAISGNSFSGTNLDAVAVWTSEIIDISNFSDVNISVDLAEINFNQSTDYVRVYFTLDGGTSTELSYTTTPTNNFNSSTASTSSPLNGNELIIRVEMRDSRDIEYAIFDNVAVTGEKFIPTSITIENTLTNTYNTGANSSLQIISFPTFPSYSTTSDLTALAWDGNIGGVFAMNVTGTLTLNHNINLDEKGFRGGAVNPGTELSPRNCNPEVYITNNGQYGRKGEGIYKNTNSNYIAARAKMANGGGGGNRHNSGAGGGGNFTAGGSGGPGYNESNPSGGCNDDPSGDAGTGAGAYGGADLSDYISADRIFMGGGGGGGQQDATNGASEDGANGGGIIIIKADEISVPCGTGVSITANGGEFPYPAVDAGWEGAPGAGAGGTLLFQVNTWTLTCTLTTEAKGGEGQSSVYTLPHGGGGGGGRGVSIFSGSVPASNFTADNSQGPGGLNGTNPASGSAAGGSITPVNPTYAGTDGVIESEQGPLPIQLLFWKGEIKDGINHLTWATATEIDNNFFTVERSVNGVDWKKIATVNGAGSSSQTLHYQLEDRYPYDGLIYYRLSQTDYDGTTELFETIALKATGLRSNLLLFPNPNTGLFSIQIPNLAADSKIAVEVMDISGQSIDVRYEKDFGQIKFDLSDKPAGNYIIRLVEGNSVKHLRVQKR